MSCAGNCQQGRKPCTCRDLPAPTAPLSDYEPDGGTVATVLAIVAVVWLVAVVIAPFLAGWWHP